ncbi:MAG: hypothetical protein IIY77_09765 [Lachnospiraceae bacterium]|nr:hypothetical protein [Lachnospiraceae bacterium]
MKKSSSSFKAFTVGIILNFGEHELSAKCELSDCLYSGEGVKRSLTDEVPQIVPRGTNHYSGIDNSVIDKSVIDDPVI